MAVFPGTQTRPPPPRFRRRPRWPEEHEKHEAARDAIDLATFRRIYDETMSAALLDARDAPTEADAEAIREQASSRVSSIESANPRVQQAYERFFEGAQARYADAFARQAVGIEDKRVNDRARLEYNKCLDEGDVAGALKSLELLRIRNPEDTALIEQEQADTPYLSVERQAFRDIRSGDLAQAQRGLADFRDTDTTGLNSELLERRHKLIRSGQAEVDYQQNQNFTALYDGLLKMDAESQSPLEQHAASQELNQSIRDAVQSGAIDAHHGVTLQSARRTSDTRFAAGRVVKADVRVQGVAQELLLGINSLTTDEDFAKARKWLFDNADKIGATYQQIVKDLHLRRKEPPDGLKDAITVATARYPIAPEERAAFIQHVGAVAKGKELGAADLNALVAEEAVAWQAAHRAFPESKLSTLLGYLETGTRFIGPMAVLSKIASRRDAIDLIYQEGWFDPRLRPEERAQIRAVLDAKYAFGDEVLPLHPSEPGAAEPTGGGRLNLRGEQVGLQVGPESLEGWKDLTAEQQEELKRRWSR